MFYSSLSGGQTGDGHTEGGAGHIVQAHLVAELHGSGVAAVLAADAHMDVGAGLMAQLDGHGHQLAHALLIQVGEGIGLVDLILVVIIQELARVVTGEAEGHLSQIVGAEGEELGLLGDLVGGEGGTGDLDHGAHLILHIDAGGGDDGVGGLDHHVLDVFQLLDLAHQGDHDLGHHGPVGVLLLDVDGGVDDGGGLHGGDLRIGHGQAAATVTHHGVELVEGVDDVVELLHGEAHLVGNLHDILLLGGEELMQRGVQETDDHGMALHGLVDALEVALLVGHDLGQGLLPVGYVVGDDHLTDGLDALALKEHMLGAAQADALRAEGIALSGVPGIVGIGVHLELAVLVGPAHQAAEVAGAGIGGHGGDGLAVNIAGGAVQTDPVALVVFLAGQGKLLALIVHHDVAAAGHAAGAHAPGHHGGVRSHAAPDGEDALGNLHTLDVLGGGLQPDQNDLLAPVVPLLGVLGGKDHPAAGGAGRGGQALADDLGLLQGLGVKGGVEQGVQLLGINAAHGLLLVDHALVHQIHGHLDGGGGGALAVAGLEHIELAVLDGKLHVLHILVVLLQAVGDVGKLLVDSGHLLVELGDGGGSTYAGHHVLALGVDEVLAEEGLLTGGGVAGEGHAGARVVAGVAEHHGLDVDGGAPVVGDLVHAAVHVGAGIVPGAEHGLDGLHQLNLGVLGEVLALFLLVELLEEDHQVLHVVGVQLHVLLDALFGLHLVDDLLKALLGQLHHHVGEHLDEAAVGVVGETGIVGELGQALHHHVVEAQVEDGVHHTRHGGPGAGADGDQQGVLGVGELLAADLLHLAQVLVNLGLDVLVDLTAIVIVLGAGLGGDGKALRHRHTQVGHFSQVGALAAQQLPHGAVAFGEQVDVLVRIAHFHIPPKFVPPERDRSLGHIIPF